MLNVCSTYVRVRMQAEMEGEKSMFIDTSVTPGCWNIGHKSHLIKHFIRGCCVLTVRYAQFGFC